MSSPLPRPRGYTRLALSTSLFEAMIASGMFAATETWLVPLLQVRLGAAAHLIGYLSIVPQLVGISVGPWVRPIIARCGGNKAVAVGHSFLQALFLLLLAIPLHAPPGPWTVPVAMALIIGIGAVGVVGGPAWMAWMGDLIPSLVRGRFNAFRTRIFFGCKLVFAGLFAGITSQLPLADNPWGIQVILLVAAASRIVGTLFMLRQPEPGPRRRIADPGPASGEGPAATSALAGLWEFIRTMPRTDLGRWTMVWAALNLGMMVSGPFFMPYMLADAAAGGLALHHQPYLLTALMYTSTVVRLISYPAAGRLVDLHGPAACLRVGVIIIGLTPIGWILAPDALWLMVPEAITGVGWCLAECSVGTMLMGCHPDASRRSALIGRHQTVVGTMVVLGGCLGVFLMTPGLLPVAVPVPVGPGSPFHTLFAISMLLRLPAIVLACTFLPDLKALPAHLAHEGALWRLIPGSGLTLNIGRGLLGFFRRDEGE